MTGILRRDVEGVLFTARGVVGGKVEGVEVELLGFYLRALRKLPSHRDESIGDVLGQDRDWVPSPGRMPRRRQGDVYAFGDQDRCVALGAQCGQPFVVTALDLRACDVDPLAGIGALVFRQGAQRLARQGQRRAVAQMLGFDARQGVKVRGSFDGLLGGGDGSGQGVGRQVDGLITHAAAFSLLTILDGSTCRS